MLMRKVILSKLVLLSSFIMMSLLSMAQAKKPTIMIVPADTYCSRNGYVVQKV